MVEKKKKSWLREELHEAEHELGDFEKKVEKGLRHAEKKYGTPIGKTREKFYSVYDRLPPEKKFQVKKYLEIFGLPAVGILMFGIAKSELALPSAVLSEALAQIDLLEKEHEFKKMRARSKLEKVV